MNIALFTVSHMMSQCQRYCCDCYVTLLSLLQFTVLLTFLGTISGLPDTESIQETPFHKMYSVGAIEASDDCVRITLTILTFLALNPTPNPPMHAYSDPVCTYYTRCEAQGEYAVPLDDATPSWPSNPPPPA